MEEYDAGEYIIKADSHYYNAVTLYKIYVENAFSHHRYDPLAHIVASCSLAGEIYIKAYLNENNIDYDHNHKMMKHLAQCVKHEESFKNIEKDIEFLVYYTSDINYPNERKVSKSNAKQAIKAVENIFNFGEIKKLRMKYNIEDVETLVDSD